MDFFESKKASEPAALCYEAIEFAKSHKYNLVIIDTAGRADNNKNLMDQMAKIIKVIKKHDINYPNQSIVVIDATLGRTSLRQIDSFNNIIDLTGIILTKYDGRSNGGILLSLSEKKNLKVLALGVGEGIEDIKLFNKDNFIKGIFQDLV